jgi:hypothetical protein
MKVPYHWQYPSHRYYFQIVGSVGIAGNQHNHQCFVAAKHSQIGHSEE